ncbi:PLD nuclease N-terminal domain-containing protein [Pseudonocardia lacus]|uniref:PLD nuclease N-terminal domain-containing protein n=1 Tax=Pseudonocardia lacus TaxID=2835865 RepID=UPI001BDD063B|nr:PLD nuclease N-terminal domain-containing protein [Pseudonocardia lacus]
MAIGNARSWSELPPAGRAGVVVGATVQVGLLVAALADLRRRPAAQVNGPRWAWALASFVNFVGPLAYFAFGRCELGRGRTS